MKWMEILAFTHVLRFVELIYFHKTYRKTLKAETGCLVLAKPM
jgi:hypothetical protein